MSTMIENKGKTHSHRNGGNAHMSSRKAAIQSIQSREPVNSSVDYTRSTVSEIYGSNVFNRHIMRTMLPKAVYKAVLRCLDHGERLDANHADIVANAMNCLLYTSRCV